jgi:hypothetical protein
MLLQLLHFFFFLEKVGPQQFHWIVMTVVIVLLCLNVAGKGKAIPVKGSEGP